MLHLLTDFLLIFVPMFVVIDPAGTVPLYIALTRREPELRRRHIARRATFVAGVVGIVFILVGQGVFAILGVRFADFQIAGGLLLVILSVVDLLSSGKPTLSEKAIEEAASQMADTVSVVPLAVPLIIGPATMTTSLLLVATYTPRYALPAPEGFGPHLGPVVVMGLVSLALVLNLVVLYYSMRFSTAIERIVGKTSLLVITKIVMILLAAIAVSLIRQGITSIVTDLQKH